MPAGATTVLPGGDRTTVLPGREEPGPDATHVAPAPGGPGSTRPAPRRAAPLPPNRRRFVWPLMIAALLIVAGALVLARKPKTTVPELRGLSRGGVSARAGRHDLKPDFARRYSSSTPRNVAISQDPEPGARVGEGSTVRVTLSDGPAPVSVPQLKGKGIAAARDALDKLGLRARVRERTSSGTPSGTVLGQSPAPPAKAVPGTSVRLTVAAEPSWHTVTTFAAKDKGQSVPFRIRGERWRLVYEMAYEKRCKLLVLCFGPSATITRLPGGQQVDAFDLDDGSGKTRDVRGEPGVYQVSVAKGEDRARWSMSVQDFY